jgi:hypothetical protein
MRATYHSLQAIVILPSFSTTGEEADAEKFVFDSIRPEV